jgi:glycosyltransferase involved in cell wall biosynthesis
MDQLVSIILPVCNAQDNLSICLDSLLNQKHQNFEVIAIDDNSKDKSVSILKDYKKIDRRIKLSTNVKRYGLAITLNRAIRKAKGNFITFMNSSDKNSVWRIKKQLEFLNKNPKIVAVGTQAINIDKKGKIIEKSDLPYEHDFIYKNFIRGISVQFETIMINRRLIPRDLLCFSHNKYPFVYIEAFVKLFRYGNFANLTDYLYYRREKPANLSKMTAIERVSKLINLTIKSVAIYDYHPSLRALFSPFSQINLN